jgi:hypothetical protein
MRCTIRRLCAVGSTHRDPRLLDRLRQRQPTVSLNSSEGGAESRSVISISPSALEIVEREETSLCVQRCLDFLPDQQADKICAASIATPINASRTHVQGPLRRP